MISTTKLPNDPIVVVTIASSIEHYLAHKTIPHQQTQSYLGASNESLYVIYDTRPTVDLSYSDILLWLDEYREYKEPGSPLDPRLYPVIVGDNPLCSVWVKKVRQMFGRDIPLYPALQDAILAIQGTYPTATSA